MRGAPEVVLERLAVAGKTWALQKEAIVEGLYYLLELLSKEQHAKAPGERFLDVQEGVASIEKIQDGGRLRRHRHDRIGVVHGIAQAEDLLPPERGGKDLHRPQPRILVGPVFRRTHGS